ncbi:hypothetical protein [Gordonia sp. CPCC 205333]|uniref:hypothetical protein n=1 Tax=Gordonia sp. CPCC 205333 TaxID=3140790 RepID=UPI003AF372C1
MLFGATGIALVGLVAAIVGAITQDWISLIGWGLAGPLAIVVLGLFVAADTKRQAEPAGVWRFRVLGDRFDSLGDGRAIRGERLSSFGPAARVA